VNLTDENQVLGVPSSTRVLFSTSNQARAHARYI
jgi:hypothetical protein